MSVTLQIKRGLAADLPSTAPVGELYYATDTNILYIGTGTSVVELNNAVNLTLNESDIQGIAAEATSASAVNPVLVSGKGADGNQHDIKTDNTGTVAVNVQNFPGTQAVSGSVSVSNFPATQPVSGTVAVSNFPATVEVSDGTNVIGTSTHPLRTDPTGTTTQPVSGSVSVSNLPATQSVSASSLPLPSGAATSAKQPAPGTAGAASADVISIQGVASMTPVKVDGSGVTQPVSGSVSVSNLPSTQAVSAASLPLPSGAATAAKQPALGTAGTPSADVITVQGAASMTALKVDGSATTQPVSGTVSLSSFPASQSVVGGGAEATALRVTIANDSTGVLSVDDNGNSLTVDGTVAATQSGTWTVQPGNTPNTTAWLTSQTPATSGGLTSTHLISAGSTNATNVKGSAGQLYGWSLQNTSSSARYVKIFNKATSPTVGTDTPVLNLYIPPTSGNNFSSDTGIAFATGIGFAITTGPTDTDSGAVSANDVLLNLFYK